MVERFMSTKRETIVRHIVRVFRSTPAPDNLDVLIEALGKIDSQTRRVVYARLTEAELALLVGGDVSVFLATRTPAELEAIATNTHAAEQAYRDWRRWERAQAQAPAPERPVSIYAPEEQPGNVWQGEE